jgi:diadenosine tetraphosphate (Ap4A) HIT family hydrolase
MNCEICEHKFEDNILFENERVIIMLAINPATSGHIQIFPKAHYTIIEQVPNEEIEYLSLVANKLSILLFETLRVHGTNIIIQNGVPAGQMLPHVSMNIIPRRNDDGLKLDWDMKQATPESLDSIHRILNEGLIMADPAKASEDKNMTATADNPVAQATTTEPEKPGEKITSTNKKTNYYLKSLERIP